MMYLWRGVRAWVLPLIQLVPALHQFDDHGVAEVDELEACHVGTAVHEALEVDILETLEGQQAEKVFMDRKYTEVRGIHLIKFNCLQSLILSINEVNRS